MVASVGVPLLEGDWEHYPRKFGKYHLLAPLAQGGMGALYLAVAGDRGLERMMVIKTVLPHLADAEYVARFRDEAKVVVKLSHGNLIPVFDAGLVGGELFLAMDFVEGRDLRAVWNRCAKKQVAFPIDIAVYIVKELCRGLAYAHGFRARVVDPEAREDRARDHLRQGRLHVAGAGARRKARRPQRYVRRRDRA